MKAVLLKGAFDIDRLTLEEEPRPTAGESEILVRMQAASLNYVDLAAVSGKLDPNISLPFIPVADGSGVVEEVGKNVNAFAVGDRVATVYTPCRTSAITCSTRVASPSTGRFTVFSHVPVQYNGIVNDFIWSGEARSTRMLSH